VAYARVHRLDEPVVGAARRTHAVDANGLVACQSSRSCPPRVGEPCCVWSNVLPVEDDAIDCGECRHRLGLVGVPCVECGHSWYEHWTAHAAAVSGCCAEVPAGSPTEAGLYESTDCCDCDEFRSVPRSPISRDLTAEMVAATKDLVRAWEAGDIAGPVNRLRELADDYDAVEDARRRSGG
jgi:hypothetical protein